LSEGLSRTPEVITLQKSITINAPVDEIYQLFGADPKHALDDDMVRLKSLFEYGKAMVHGHRLTREQLEHEIELPREESGAVRTNEQTPDQAA
jgi:hypothetical protein